MNFYQSLIRKQVLQEVYRRQVFTIDLNGVSYLGQMKQKSLLGMTSKRYMIHGFDYDLTQGYEPNILEIMRKLKRDYGRGRGDIMFQLGCSHSYAQYDHHQIYDAQQIQSDALLRKSYQSKLYQWYSLRASIKEHMPMATVVLPIGDAEYSRTQYSSSAKRYINKAAKHDLHFEVASTPAQRERFYQVWYATAFGKWFSVIAKAEYDRLASFLQSTPASWSLFLVYKGAELVCGAIYLIQDDSAFYLYGATDRSFGEIGAYYRMQDHINQYYKQVWTITSLDLLGVSPLWYPKHHLMGVSRAKQAFGGSYHAYIGNYDLVFQPMLYQAMKWR